MKNFREGLLILFFGFYLYLTSLVLKNYLDSIFMEIVVGSTLIGMLGYSMQLAFINYSKKNKLLKRFATIGVFLMFVLLHYILV